MRVTAETDVLVVGGGGAGFKSAIAARETGRRVVLVSKGPLARCGATPMAAADFTLDGRSMSLMEGLKGDPNDSPEKVFNDIVTQGCFLNNQKLVEQYIATAPRCLRELIEWGMHIKASDERMVLTSGTGIMDVLLRKARSIGVDLLEDVFLLDLVTVDGRIAGALGLNVRTGDFITLQCKAVVMATGGWHKAFRPNTGMRDLSGEGIAMAFRAGATLGNLEFITFCCNVFLHPPMWRGSIAPYVLSLVIGGRLTNSAGEEFLKNYDPIVVKAGTSTEWNKSFLSHASMKEVRAGKGSPRGGVYFSRGKVPWETTEAIASFVFPKWRYKALDLSEWGRKLKENEPVEVGPAVEYFEGGIKVNERFETTVPGLFAAGECALGAFGANRVFSAITEMLVQGTAAGAYAASYAAAACNAGAKAPGQDEAVLSSLREKAEAPLRRPGGLRPAEVRRRVQEAAHRCLGPIRNREEMESFADFLKSVRKDELPRLATTPKGRTYNKEWVDALELQNMVQLLEMTTASALFRTESRGVHFREDYPVTDNDQWLKESMVKGSTDGFEVTEAPLTMTALSPPVGVMPYLEFIRKMMESRSDTGGKH